MLGCSAGSAGRCVHTIAAAVPYATYAVVFVLLIELPHFLMERKMLLGL